MIFNGHTQDTIDALDEATWNEITVMYADGLIGNKSLIATLGKLVTGVFNYIRPNNSTSYTLKDIIPRVYDYIYPPLSKEQQYENTQHNLKAFLLSKAPVGMFKE